MAVRNVTVKGLAEIEAKLNASVLLDPRLQEITTTFVDRLLRPSKGLGARNNTLSPEMRELGATIRSTLNWPRTTGAAMHRKQEGIVKGMAPRVIGKAISDIEARWAS